MPAPSSLASGSGIRSSPVLQSVHTVRTVRCEAKLVPSAQVLHVGKSWPTGCQVASSGTRHAQGRQASLQVCHAAATAKTVHEHVKKITYGGEFEICITVAELEDGSQHLRITTNHPSKNLILHWGVEGGKDYQGGWRLPNQQPKNTVNYKDRALQTSWNGNGGDLSIDIHLDGDEASDRLNFVLKDEATATWYDLNGSNFQCALRSSLRSLASMDAASFQGALLSREDIDVAPSKLCGKWSHMLWQNAGCPTRSPEESDMEYQTGVKEIESCLMRGKSIDELWQVANGEVNYADFKRDFIDLAKPSAASESKSFSESDIPIDIINKQAYVMWEQDGRKDGADYGDDAKRLLLKQLQSGTSLQEIQQRLEPKGKPRQEQQRDSGHSATQKERKHMTDAVELGQDIGLAAADPMSMIKRATPKLSEEKKVRKEKPLDFLVQKAALSEDTKFRRVYNLNQGTQLLVVVSQAEESDVLKVQMTTDDPNEIILHWGVGMGKHREWTMPPASVQPAGSVPQAGGIAADTPFQEWMEDEVDADLLASKVALKRVTLCLPSENDFANLQFVLRSEDGSMWWRDGASNFNVPVPKVGQELGPSPSPVADALTVEIIDAENTNAWTLMHRFNKTADILRRVLDGDFEDPAHATAALYVWLRYSSTRHLTWQRHYNTQPRFLSGAQDNLTKTIAEAHRKLHGEAQEWARLMLSTVGRGGDGQKIRDEILNIMHRNNIKEVNGTWMEAWHQKLHNNTTPDDVPICEAYIEFLRSNGNADAYWRVLSDAGISKARMEGFDRPVKGDPEFLGDRKDALIGEFQNYLGILKAVHSGADMQNSAKNAGGSIPGAAGGHLGYVMGHLGSNQVLPLIQNAVACRTALAGDVLGNRDLLYLDLALEDVIRGAAERGASALGIGAAAFVGPLLQNLVLSLGDNEELCYCLKAWQALPRNIQCGSSPGKEEALRATAVVDRIRRALGDLSNNVVERIEPVSTAIGENCGVESWAVELFAEEVVRGGPAFAVSLVLSTVEPALRQAAELGSWQIISPANVTGRIVVVSGLHEVQEEVYTEATILVAQRVSGEEEIPEGAIAVVTPDAPDILSHVSVRARNMKVLFATCHEPEPLDEIAKYAGKVLSFETTAAGSVVWNEASDSALSSDGPSTSNKLNLKITVPDWSGKWVVPMSDFSDGVVGAKSKNLLALRGKVPDWIGLPSSITLPFGCFEEALNDSSNKDIKNRLKAASKQVSLGPVPALLECRDTVMEMHVPSVCRDALTTAMQGAGLSAPDSPDRWAAADQALLGVWASKFNDRAYYSMRKVGLNFMDLRMAVVVQRVVPARYAFVIHTNNPSSGATDEVYCELVKGLGETLVSGLVPGSALSFVAKKSEIDKPTVLTFPSKSEGMFVRESLIFRSDSNGEDLAGYAGAGLYESITMDTTVTKKVDYSDDQLMVDENFRQDLLARICKVGLAIEESMDSPQDIEGVVDPDGNITVVQTRPQV